MSVEDNNDDVSDARSPLLKSHEYDYFYHHQPKKKVYLPVFVGEREKKKSTSGILFKFVAIRASIM